MEGSQDPQNIMVQTAHPETELFPDVLGPLMTQVPASCCCLIAKWTLLQSHGLSLLCPWDFPGKHTGVGGHAVLQVIFSAQGSHLRLLH